MVKLTIEAVLNYHTLTGRRPFVKYQNHRVLSLWRWGDWDYNLLIKAYGKGSSLLLRVRPGEKVEVYDD